MSTADFYGFSRPDELISSLRSQGKETNALSAKNLRKSCLVQCRFKDIPLLLPLEHVVAANIVKLARDTAKTQGAFSFPGAEMISELLSFSQTYKDYQYFLQSDDHLKLPNPDEGHLVNWYSNVVYSDQGLSITSVNTKNNANKMQLDYRFPVPTDAKFMNGYNFFLFDDFKIELNDNSNGRLKSLRTRVQFKQEFCTVNFFANGFPDGDQHPIFISAGSHVHFNWKTKK